MNKFITAAIIQGAIFVGLTIFLVLGQISLMKPEVSRVIAAGGVGSWFTMGYIMYLVIGVIGVATSAIFYLYFERLVLVEKSHIKKKAISILSWIHLLFMNIGTTIGMGMMMYVGYNGGASMLPVSAGGKGLDAGQTHHILAPFVEPIGIGILLISFGVIAGGIGFLLRYNKKLRAKEEYQQEEDKQQIL
jgi:hypothetical protein